MHDILKFPDFATTAEILFKVTPQTVGIGDLNLRTEDIVSVQIETESPTLELSAPEYPAPRPQVDYKIAVFVIIAMLSIAGWIANGASAPVMMGFVFATAGFVLATIYVAVENSLFEHKFFKWSVIQKRLGECKSILEFMKKNPPTIYRLVIHTQAGKTAALTTLNNRAALNLMDTIAKTIDAQKSAPLVSGAATQSKSGKVSVIKLGEESINAIFLRYCKTCMADSEKELTQAVKNYEH